MSHIRGLLDDVKSSLMAHTPPGEYAAEVVPEAKGLRKDLQALANATLEISKAVRRIDDRFENASHFPNSRDPGQPPEQNLTIQRKTLEPYSSHGHITAPAKGLARRRIEATPDPFFVLD